MKIKPCDYCGGTLLPQHGIVNVTEQVDGKWSSFHACHECAKKIVDSENGKDIKPITDKPEVEIELIGNVHPEELIQTAEGIMEMLMGKPSPRPEFLDKKPCPHCELSIEDFIKTGKFGCSYCYEHYEEELLPILMIHQDGHDKHIGKIPKAWQERKYSNPEEKRKLLLLQKAKAVELEQYEEAAKLADEIRHLDDPSSPS